MLCLEGHHRLTKQNGIYFLLLSHPDLDIRCVRLHAAPAAPWSWECTYFHLRWQEQTSQVSRKFWEFPAFLFLILTNHTLPHQYSFWTWMYRTFTKLHNNIVIKNAHFIIQNELQVKWKGNRQNKNKNKLNIHIH